MCTQPVVLFHHKARQPAADQMQVEMEDRLPGMRACVDDQPVPVLEPGLL